MKFFKYGLIVSQAVFFSYGISFALNVCPGEVRSVSWSSSGATTCSVSVNSSSFGCRLINSNCAGGPVGVTAPTSGSCTASMTGTGPGGTDTKSDVLNVVNGPQCCNKAGTSQAGLPYWNGSSCQQYDDAWCQASPRFYDKIDIANNGGLYGYCTCTSPRTYVGGRCTCPTGTTWNGVWGAGATCTTPVVNCSAITKSWGAACSGSTANTTSGSNYTVTNTNASYTGTATYSCNNGTWSGPSSQSCTLKTYSCSGSVPVNAVANNISPLTAAGTYSYSTTAGNCKYQCNTTSHWNNTSCVVCSGATPNWNQATLSCVAGVTAPTATISVSPTTIAYNTASTITWGASANSTTCTAGGSWGNSGNLSSSGSTGPLTTSQTYAYYCTNSAGNSSTVSATVTVCASGQTVVGGVCVTPQAAPTAWISASPTSVPNGVGTTLSWGSSNTVSCSRTGVLGNWATMPTSNSGTIGDKPRFSAQIKGVSRMQIPSGG